MRRRRRRRRRVHATRHIRTHTRMRGLSLSNGKHLACNVCARARAQRPTVCLFVG